MRPADLPGLFITGTDTGVGKTRVAAAVLRLLRAEGVRVGALKPVATGAVESPTGPLWEDTELLRAALGVPMPPERVTPITFLEPLAPPVAARRAGRLLMMLEILGAVDDALTRWSSDAEVMVVEGVGGLLCPLAEGATVADLALALDYPLIVVARRGLGTLNHTLLTVEAARWRGLRVAGVVLNGAESPKNPVAEATNAAELARRLDGIALLADIEHGDDAETPLSLMEWSSLAAPRRMR